MKPIKHISIAIVGIIFISASMLQSQNCVVPDNGTGTATLPPIGCQYQSVDPFMIIDGLPPGTTIELHGTYSDFTCCGSSCPNCSLPLPPGECEMPGGSLGGDGHCFLGQMVFNVIGTGELEGFQRILFVDIFSEIHTGPRIPGNPVQTFQAVYYRFEGELLGDPDFCTFHIAAGEDFGLPSPGQTTLTELPNGNFNVDSFFDITYQIEFEGCPGSVLDGFMGTTTGTTRFEIPSFDYFIDPGPDYWTVPESPMSSVFPGGPGGDLEPIPADFFGPGSDPFDGVIHLKGESLESSEFPNSDAIIERLSEANLPQPYPASDAVQTEIVELDLISISPITITYNGGQYPELWDVEMVLSTTPQPQGNMNITKNDASGGVFNYSPLFVYPKLIFTKTTPPNNSLTWDLGGISLLEYTNSTAYPWEHSPMGNDFNPSGTSPMELISAGGDCELYLNPYLLRQDDFWAEVGMYGYFENGGGSGFNDGQWYEYPNYNWWNIWFYDHPYDSDRTKALNISFTLQPNQDVGNATIVINWATGAWSEQGVPGRPPLPEDVPDQATEDLYIVRSLPVFSGQVTEPIYIDQYFYEILEYNPEWISIDVQGYNFAIYDGVINHVCKQPDNGGELYEFGDAPELALAYPSLGITGIFPTCMNEPVAGFVSHADVSAWFGESADYEPEGNAGLCPVFNPDTYNQDECFNDGDAGLIIPESYTITGPVGSETVQPCAGVNGTAIGYVCQSAVWGVDIDIDLHNHIPSGEQAYVNLLVDWDQNGQWVGSANCPGYAVPEHVLVDFPIPNPFDGPLSVLIPAGSTIPIGPNPGYVWVRFSVSEVPVGQDWNGEGFFEYGETEDYLLLVNEQQEEIDWGDAPDNSAIPQYPTLSANNGAGHIIDGVTFLGALIDAEPDGLPDPNALGDDNTNLPDEDGIIFNQIMQGSPAQITVTTSTAGYLQGWMDFNADGDWADPDEQIFIDEYIHFGYTVCLNYLVPVNANLGTTFARFRFSTVPGLSYTGLASDGEVEDYEVEIIQDPDYKWIQEPCVELPGLHCHDNIVPPGIYDYTILADDWQCNGGLVTDIHWWGNYEAQGSGINYFHLSIHNNDPTGCVPLNPEIWGVDVSFALVNETNTGLFNSEGGIIYEYDYFLDIPFEQIEGNTYWFDICAYSNDPNNPALWRWQESDRSTVPVLCTAASMSSTTSWQSIIWDTPQPTRYSDMAFAITSEAPEAMDYGDAADPNYPTLLASDGARHNIDGVTFLGALIDAEPDGLSDPNALGDDNNNLDDEDGVTFTSPIYLGQSATVDVVASVDGVLNAWMDFDGNGSWGDFGEQIFTNVTLTAGINNLTYYVSPNGVAGTSYARFRFNTSGGLAYTGHANDGEVEDYEVNIETGSYKWAQYPDPEWPGLHAHDWDFEEYQSIILADDWLCEGGWVTDIHWWGNYEMDMAGLETRGAGIQKFHLSIHAHDPAACLPVDPEIWGVDVPFNALTELFTGVINLEGSPIYLYEYDLVEPFQQIEGTQYWLDITAVCVDPMNPALWRWQESGRSTTPVLCGAAEKDLPNPGVWNTIFWANEMYSDMAFIITSEPAPALDFGDANDPTYPTLLANNGARHIIDGVTYLGNMVDAETNGLPDANALGDDNNNFDDEDGVSVIFALNVGGTGGFSIDASVDGILNAWIDFDRNGSWAEANEHVFQDYSLSAGNNWIFFTVPANANVGTTYARFRFSSVGGLSYTGIAPDGEVEDYEVAIIGDLDFGDAPDQALPAYPTLLANNGARHLIDTTVYLGYSIDLETDGQPDITATGDDNDGNDDEDGVIIPAVLSHGCMNTITVIASVDGYLNGWIDFNSSGNWVEADEHVLIDQSVTAGTNVLNISIPVTSVKGTSYARFRFSTVPGLSYVGQAPDGEVEDYQIEIGEPEKWIQEPDLSDFGLDVDATAYMPAKYPENILADDFLCTTTGPLTRIEIWGSWYHDHYPWYEDPGAVSFTLSIHKDIPADESPTGYSMPGDVLWLGMFNPNDFMFEPYAMGLSEGWYDPSIPLYEPFGDTECWKYIFDLSQYGETFVQEGTSDEPVVYWLDVQALPMDYDPECRFGWKTSVNHWNDDAVWTIGYEPYMGDWNELFYPATHPLEGQSIDLAFAIYGLESPYILVDLTAMLEGPFNGADMNTSLNTAGIIPLNQPFDIDPLAKWYYTGTESVSGIPNTSVTDWLLVELRDAVSAPLAAGSTRVEQRAAFVLNDGSIVATDGSSMIKFYTMFVNDPYVVLWHRNHLGVLSANPMNMVGLGLYSYDFTTGAGQAYNNGQKDIGGGIYGMLGGDAQPDGLININDKNLWTNEAGTTGYKAEDFNLDTQVDNKDKNDIWVPNNGEGTQVPN